MNITYLIIEALVTLFAIYIITNDWLGYGSRDSKIFFGVVTVIASVVMLAIGFTPITNIEHITIKDAYSQRMGNEVIVKVDGWPTQITTKIEFLESPLQIKRTELRNAWGIECTSLYNYEIQTNKPLIKTKLQ